MRRLKPIKKEIRKPKPILLFKLPDDLNQEVFHKITESIHDDKNLVKDYHILCTSNIGSNELELQVFYEKDFNKVKYDELRSIVQGKLKDYERQG